MDLLDNESGEDTSTSECSNEPTDDNKSTWKGNVALIYKHTCNAYMYTPIAPPATTEYMLSFI